MVLHIKSEYVKSQDMNVMVLKADMLKEKGTHLFIASNSWESITVELYPGLDYWYLHFLPSVCENIQVIAHDSDLSPYVQCLTELFPEKSGAIRRAIMQKQSLNPILGEHLQMLTA